MQRKFRAAAVALACGALVLCSYRDIAAILGITETNVATKLSRLKERLRQNLTQTKE